MESTQNKIYEIEDSALIDENLKNAVDDDLIEETKGGKHVHLLNTAGDDDLFTDQFDESGKGKDGSGDRN